MAVRGEKEKDTYPGVNIPVKYNGIIFEGFTFFLGGGGVLLGLRH